MEWIQHNFTVSTDKMRLDLEVIHGFLKTSYWASERSLEDIRTAIEASICFGLYDGKDQVGFARFVTDRVAFCWLGDVFIIPEYQKRGLGKWLVKCIVSHPLLEKNKCILGTRDAHGLYELFGFERREMMSRPAGGGQVKQ